MLSCWMSESLQEFIEASLLQPFDIVFHFVVKRKLKLVKVELVPRRNRDDFVVIVELRLADLLGELGVVNRCRFLPLRGGIIVVSICLFISAALHFRD